MAEEISKQSSESLSNNKFDKIKKVKEVEKKEVKPREAEEVNVEEVKVEEISKQGFESLSDSKESDKKETEIEEIKVEEPAPSKEKKQRTEFDKESWKPKTNLGKKVKDNEITDLSEILDNGMKILEPGIIDVLLPGYSSELLLIGQSKGKFGGGQRRVFRQTQKKTQEGNKPKFATMAVIGNNDGFVGVGFGKSKETVPAREKSMRRAKLDMIKIKRGCGSWQCGCKEPHTIPFTVKGKCGSVIIELMPAPKGTGLRIQKECQKILKLAGVKDIWSKTKGQTKSSVNLVMACMGALKNLMKTKINPEDVKNLGVIEGSIKKNEGELNE